MAIIIDGYNFLFSDRRELSRLPVGDLEKMRNDFVGRLARLRAIEDVTVTVIFDGGPEGEGLPRQFTHHGVKVVFSDRPGTADTEILKLIADSTAARDTEVVTDDNLLRSQVRKLGARTVSTDEYKKHMRSLFHSQSQAHKEPVEKFEGPAQSEVDFWMRQFGQDPTQSPPDSEARKGKT